MKIVLFTTGILTSFIIYGQHKGQLRFSLGSDLGYPELVLIPILAWVADEDDEDDIYVDDEDDEIKPWEWDWFK